MTNACTVFLKEINFIIGWIPQLQWMDWIQGWDFSNNKTCFHH